MNVLGKIAVFTKEGCFFSIKDTTWDRRKCSLFTVEGCSPKTNRAISPIGPFHGIGEVISKN